MTADDNQLFPDVAGLPTGSMVAWADELTGVRLQALDAAADPSGVDAQVADAEAFGVSVASDEAGLGLVAWQSESPGGRQSIFVRSVSSGGAPVGLPREITAPGGSDSEDPDVAAFPDGGFLVVFGEEDEDSIQAQLFEADGSPAATGTEGVVGVLPFEVSDGGGVAVDPAVAGHADGTFFVVWQDSAIDGSGTGIAGRLFGTDVDADDVPGLLDNCPDTTNPDQSDVDADGAGDSCDACPGSDDRLDADGDATADGCDTCTDTDADGFGDPGFDANTCPTDNCPDLPNADQADADDDGVGDACDTCFGDDASGDSDGDSVCDNADACEGSDDALDADLDGVPDGCDLCLGDDASGDGDSDGFCADRDCDDSDPENACLIFQDDFESGDLSAWSGIVP
ncbi:MAG: hypothetical protein AAGM22_19120 [Acidobacteriota bacterium]